MMEKVNEMEQAAYKDYTESAHYNGEDVKKTQELKFRWLGMLEIKRELLRNA